MLELGSTTVGPMYKLFNKKAFTLIELLVVILIIAILIAVAAPSFLGQQNKAHDSAALQQSSVALRSGSAIYVEDQEFPVLGADQDDDSNDGQNFLYQLKQSEPQLEFSTTLPPSASTTVFDPDTAYADTTTVRVELNNTRQAATYSVRSKSGKVVCGVDVRTGVYNQPDSSTLSAGTYYGFYDDDANVCVPGDEPIASVPNENIGPIAEFIQHTTDPLETCGTDCALLETGLDNLDPNNPTDRLITTDYYHLRAALGFEPALCSDNGNGTATGYLLGNSYPIPHPDNTSQAEGAVQTVQVTYGSGHSVVYTIFPPTFARDDGAYNTNSSMNCMAPNTLVSSGSLYPDMETPETGFVFEQGTYGRTIFAGGGCSGASATWGVPTLMQPIETIYTDAWTTCTANYYFLSPRQMPFGKPDANHSCITNNDCGHLANIITPGNVDSELLEDLLSSGDFPFFTTWIETLL